MTDASPGSGGRAGTAPARLAGLVLQRSHELATRSTPLDIAVRRCLRLASDLLTATETSAATARLTDAANRWAYEGIPLESLLHRVNETFRECLGRLEPGRTDRDSVLAGSQSVVAALRIISATVSRAYVRDMKAAAGEDHTTVQAFTSALLAGLPARMSTPGFAFEIHDTYTVLALSIAPHPDEGDPAVDASVVARRKLRRTQSALSALSWGGRALSLLSVDGGTVLLPGEPAVPAATEDLVAALARAAGTPITAAVATARAGDVPSSVDRAHDILDIAHRLGCSPGVHRFADFALEYQLTRPGPGREALRSLLEPLDEYPKLLDTLREHIRNNSDRRRTSEAMHIHPNTLDYRLRRIHEVTGLDPAHPAGLWQLRSAFLVREFRPGPGRAH
ncbi:helix-turn-helix domain-containing protein [Nocardia sp. NPDC024068]|uniref:PucR family transcriptional regulator n=1 Tax=Nocardia sp. NPDC024068 TaxID=3157197 RepID=UPI0033F19567